MRGNTINPKPKTQNPKSTPVRWAVQNLRPSDRQSKILWSAFIFVTLIAFFFRFYRLADHPLGLFFDPAINGLDAIRFMQRGGPVIFFPTNGGREALLIYLLIPFIWLFGATPFAFRLQLAIISLLNVVLLFGFLYDLRMANPKGRLRTGEWRVANGHKNRSTLHASRFRAQPPLGTPHISRIWFATLASLVLAVSYWHIAISRGDQRPLTVPLLSIHVFWFFLKGWASGQTRWFVLSGLFVGLGFHTYSAARLLPVILFLALLPEFLPFFSRGNLERDQFRAKNLFLNLLAFALVALLVAAPMIWYFLNHPAQFSARATSVMIWTYLDSPAAVIAELGHNLLRVLGFFCCVGSPNAIFGLPDHPGLPLLLTPFLIMGLISALKNWRDLFSRLIALWWLSGIAPSIIAIEAPHPLRMVVALVPTAILVALGLINFSTWFQSRSTFNVQRSTFYILPLVLILATIPSTFSAYFIEWTKLPITQGIYDYGAVAIRDVILEHANDTRRPIYLPLARFNDPPLLFYLSGTFERQAALSASPADSALVISPEKNELDPVWVRLQGNTATILPPLIAEGQMLIQAALAGDSAQPVRTPRGETVARLAPLSTDPARFIEQPTHPLTATFSLESIRKIAGWAPTPGESGGAPAAASADFSDKLLVHLVGAAYSLVIEPTSGELPVTLYWQATSQMVDDYEVVLHLVDDSRRVWGNGTARPNDWVYPTTFWRPGLETIAAQQKVVLETNTLDPGRYWLAVALLNPASGQRLPLSEGASDSLDTFFIGPLKVAGPSPPPFPLLEGRQVKFSDVAQLSSFRLDTPTIAAGESLSITLLWEALDTPPVDYTVFVHLLDSNDNIIASNDTQPVNNTYPTTIWTPDERILDNHTLTTPDSLPPGQYRLAIGLYYQPTGERLPLYLPDGRQDAQGRLILAQLVTVIGHQ